METRLNQPRVNLLSMLTSDQLTGNVWDQTGGAEDRIQYAIHRAGQEALVTL